MSEYEPSDRVYLSSPNWRRYANKLWSECKTACICGECHTPVHQDAEQCPNCPCLFYTDN